MVLNTKKLSISAYKIKSSNKPLMHTIWAYRADEHLLMLSFPFFFQRRGRRGFLKHFYSACSSPSAILRDKKKRCIAPHTIVVNQRHCAAGHRSVACGDLWRVYRASLSNHLLVFCFFFKRRERGGFAEVAENFINTFTLPRAGTDTYFI